MFNNVYVITSLLFIVLLRRYFRSGLTSLLSYSLFFIIFLPQTIGIVLPWALPVITIHRIILLNMFILWVLNGKYHNVKNIPFKIPIVFIIFVNTIILFNAIYFSAAFKQYLSVLIEGFLFYTILVTSLTELDDIVRAISYVYNAIFAIAIFAIIERFSTFRLMEYLPSFIQRDYSHAVHSSLPHPILLGTVLSIGILLNYYYISLKGSSNALLISLFKLFIIGTALYFSFSRGPWLATILAMLLAFFLTREKRNFKYFFIFATIPIIILLFRPGVYNTFKSLFMATLNINTLEGRSYYYRWELWNQAFYQISQDTLRVFIGYGYGYHRLHDLSGEFGLAARYVSFRSWDNHYATLLLETGIIGLFSYLIFYLRIISTFIKNIFLFHKFHHNTSSEINILILASTSIFVILFMMTNVQIFAKQVFFIFYFFTAIGANTIRTVKESKR